MEDWQGILRSEMLKASRNHRTLLGLTLDGDGLERFYQSSFQGVKLKGEIDELVKRALEHLSPPSEEDRSEEADDQSPNDIRCTGKLSQEVTRTEARDD